MLWILESVDQSNTDAVLSLLPRLSEARRARVLAMTHVPGKIRSILAELLLGHALRAEYGLTELPPVETGEKGKPFFPDRPELCFNLSHCKTAVACALDAAPLGVDVQEYRPLSRGRDRPPIYRILTPEEAAWVEAEEDPAARDRRFTAVWTCKEAYGKALGVGIAYDLRALSFLPGPDPWTQAGFLFQHFPLAGGAMTLCAGNPLALRRMTAEEFIKNEVLP